MPIPTTELTDLTITRGANVREDAPICVIVMSVHSEAGTAEAVASILDQDVEAEIVVVNTGKGSVREMLAPYADRVTLIETPTQQYAGGARNLGILNSSSSIVAFLAADCIATPGWLRRRLKGHENHRSVASAIRPTPTLGKVSQAGWATYIIRHYRRMPEVEPHLASCAGQSYERKIFAEQGLFEEQLRVGEDSAFNAAVASSVGTPLWDPGIVTLHQYPKTFQACLSDTFTRGQRLMRQNGSRAPIRTALASLKFNLQKGWRVRKTVPVAPIIFFALAAARSAGIATGKFTRE